MRSKFNAKRTEVDGIVFASKKEAKRYGELKLLEKSGVIANLQLQPKFPLRVLDLQELFKWKHGLETGVQHDWPTESCIGNYIADFSYNADPTGWKEIVEDVKGVRTPMYKLKKKLVEALYGIEIIEV